MQQMEKRGLSGAALKWIAVLTMLIDHIALALLWFGYMARHPHAAGALTLYYAMRVVGRLAFPIYCFLLAEGLYHTHSKGKYLLRLAVFALLSEIPFDLAFNRTILEFGYQNVFFTLTLGLCAAWGWERLTRGKSFWAPFLRVAGGALCVGCAMAAAWALRTDYGALGVLLIFVFWLFRGRELPLALGVAAVLLLMVALGRSHWSELAALLALLPLHAYNGRRGRQPKAFFYIFYPAHLVLLFLLRKLIW